MFLPRALRPAGIAPDSHNRLVPMLVASVALHALFLAVGFHYRPPQPALSEPLQVVLVNSRTAVRPDHTRLLAQANLDGGGNTDSDLQVQSPLAAGDSGAPALASRQQQVRQLERQARTLLAQLHHPDRQVPQPTASPAQAAAAVDLPGTAAADSREAGLEAEVARDWQAYEKRPKRRFIGARTREYRFARYVEAWRARIERIGNLNYPLGGDGQPLHGRLQLTVSIRANGTVDGVLITRTSGVPALDAAAVRIVRLAAPFAPLPSDIRRDTDILSITRTWTFTHDARFVPE